MRKVVVSNIMSLDARYEGPGKNVMALPFHPAFDEYNAKRLRAAGTILLGRITFEQMKGYWPAVPGNPDAPPAEQEVARLNNDTEKVVISDSLTPDQLAPWTNTSCTSWSARLSPAVVPRSSRAATACRCGCSTAGSSTARR